MFQEVLFVAVLASSSASFGYDFSPNNYTVLCDQLKTYRCLCPDGDTGNTVNCASKRISALPERISFPDYITDAVFKDNQITHIPSTLFKSGLKVDRIDLSHNQISFLAADAFANLNSLDLIDLSHNAIWSLALGTFRGPQYLTKLNLDYNRINNFFGDVFEDCTSLKELTMRYNSLMSFDRDSFSWLKSLEILDISNSGLSLLPDDLFINNTKLSDLQLSANSFRAVPSRGIKTATSLKRLDVSENPMDDIHPNAFIGLGKLEYLRISHMRKLTSLKAHSLAGLDSLKELRLTDNLMLNKISGLTFKKMPPVKTESTTEKSTSEDEEDEETNKHPALEKLYLRHNKLNWLPEELVDWSQLKEVDLSENPWHCDCHLSWTSPDLPKSTKEAAKCDAPVQFSGKSLSSLTESDFTCSYLTSEATVALAVLVVAAFIAALAGIGFVMYRRSTLSCRRKTQEPKYTRVVSKNERVDLEWDHTGEPDSKA